MHIEIEDSIRVGGLNTGRRWVRRVNHLHITTGAPRPAECTHRIEIPTHSPISGVLRPNECSAQAKSVLWWHATRGYVEWMISKQCVRTHGHSLKAGLAGISHTLALAPQLSLQSALLRQCKRGHTHHHEHHTPPHACLPEATASTFFCAS